MLAIISCCHFLDHYGVYVFGFFLWKAKEIPHHLNKKKEVFTCIFFFKKNVQKSWVVSKTSDLCSMDARTPAFWYSPTLFSKKLVFPCIEIISIHSNGFPTAKIQKTTCHGHFTNWNKKKVERRTPLKIFGTSKAVSKRSATNSMYWDISCWFIPMSATGIELHTNSFSIVTASRIMCCTTPGSGLCVICE